MTAPCYRVAALVLGKTEGRNSMARRAAIEKDYNPHLAQDSSGNDRGDLAEQRIEIPGERENIRWQTRAASPTDYENALGDALVAIFERGIEDLEAVIAALNDTEIRTPEGEAWSAERFERLMAELGR